LCLELGWNDSPVGGASAPGGGGRRSLGYCKVRARSGLKAAEEASVGAHGHVGVLKQWRPRAGGGALQRQWQWRGDNGMAAREGWAAV
jgi:hypothetical protein